VERDPLDPVRVARTERRQGELVSVFDTAHENRIGQPLVDERPVGPQFTLNSTGAACRGLHAPTLVRMSEAPVRLVPELVGAALRGGFGREYRYAPEATTTQLLLPPDAAHGAVALAEHQTAGRGRLGRVWVDEPGAGLTFSVALYPPPPVADWPALTLVAARAVAEAIGPGAAIKHPNDILVGGRKVAGILAEASSRVVLGIGINVGAVPWEGAGSVSADRLALLVEVLERLERGYDAWLLNR
jgi:hypothetical protein